MSAAILLVAQLIGNSTVKFEVKRNHSVGNSILLILELCLGLGGAVEEALTPDLMVKKCSSLGQGTI